MHQIVQQFRFLKCLVLEMVGKLMVKLLQDHHQDKHSLFMKDITLIGHLDLQVVEQVHLQVIVLIKLLTF